MSEGLFPDSGRWHKVTKFDVRAGELADRHYSRQTPGARDFLPPGRSLTLLTDDGRAVWAVVDNIDPRGGRHWRVTIFRNEGAGLSSELIREATERTVVFWRRRYGGLPPCPLTTEVDADAVRPKRDPGRCFRRAGWTLIGPTRSHRHRGALVFVAPKGARF